MMNADDYCMWYDNEEDLIYDCYLTVEYEKNYYQYKDHFELLEILSLDYLRYDMVS